MMQVQDLMPGGSNPSHKKKKMGKGKQQQHMILANSDNNEANPRGGHVNCERKIMRRDNERQRRQHMAVLNASLRSHLPHELIQGKRSISDHIKEAVDYINHMKRKIHELNAMREKIKRLYEYDAAGAQDLRLENESNNITVSPTCFGGVEIIMSSCCSHEEEGFSLSGVLKLLLEQGLRVVDCASTRVNERLFHTIQCEVDDLACIDLSELQLKLNYCCNSA